MTMVCHGARTVPICIFSKDWDCETCKNQVKILFGIMSNVISPLSPSPSLIDMMVHDLLIDHGFCTYPEEDQTAECIQFVNNFIPCTIKAIFQYDREIDLEFICQRWYNQC